MTDIYKHYLTTAQNGKAHFKKCKQLFEYQHLLFLRDIWWGQSSNLYLILFIFSTPVLLRHLWQLKTVVCLHWCLIHAVLLVTTEKRFLILPLVHNGQASCMKQFSLLRSGLRIEANYSKDDHKMIIR
jgi:hypothetical protein